MEVAFAIPPPMDFNFHNNCSFPYITPPSSPQQLNNNNNNNEDVNINFEFDFSGHLQRPSLSADELFHQGMIRPLNPTTTTTDVSSVKENAPQVGIDEKDNSDLLVVCQNYKSSIQHEGLAEATKRTRHRQQKRGTQRDSSSSSCNNNNNINIKDKSVSSLISETAISTATSTYCTSFLSSIWFTKGYRKWRLKDFLLFRSASEGRGTDKDPLGKYSILSKTAASEYVGNCSFRSKTTSYDDVGSCSFRSTEENSGSVSRRRVSAHELHYTVNRAASEEMKKKTLLPYKHGLLGCLRLNTGSAMHCIGTRMGSLERS